MITSIYKIVVTEEIGQDEYIDSKIYFNRDKAFQYATELKNGGCSVTIMIETPDEELGHFVTTQKLCI